MTAHHQNATHAPQAGGVFSGREVEVIKRKFDRTCEELGIFAEDEEARRKLGHNLIQALARGDIDVIAEARAAGYEVVRFEGEEMVVHRPRRPE